MNDHNEHKKADMSEVEKWMEQFFLDPLTSYMDQLTFRIDLYETHTHIIVEALLPDVDPEDIDIVLEDYNMTIAAKKKNKESCSRKIELPFRVADKRVHAHFANGILEVWIDKYRSGNGKKRYIIISE
ncbi:Hsp20/alpha crystallin family protein [Bacillus mesophilum]|nr:Hsp20/alpha crystallin family protein [Bacillus mesophilum]